VQTIGHFVVLTHSDKFSELARDHYSFWRRRRELEIVFISRPEAPPANEKKQRSEQKLHPTKNGFSVTRETPLDEPLNGRRVHGSYQHEENEDRKEEVPAVRVRV